MSFQPASAIGVYFRGLPRYAKINPRAVGSAPKQARQFECLITFQAWGHQASKLQGVRCADIPIKPVR
jgi:hypothetical protein